MTTESPYTVKAKLPELLELSPVDRGSVWFMAEDLWEQALPSYQAIRNVERQGHYGVVVEALDPNKLGTVDTLHGHSKCRSDEIWHHLSVKGLSREKPTRATLFDVLHRFPFFWRLFFTARACRYLYRPSLTDSEYDQLTDIEEKIRRKFEQDAQQALKEYRRNPAWRDCFPGQF